MRIHSNTLTAADIYVATHDLPGVHVEVTEHGSRSHTRAYEISLSGTSNRRKNPGTYGYREVDHAATWDEWGVVIARIFDRDPHAVFGTVKHPTYADSGDFDYQTAGRFDSLQMPFDTHQDHRWEFVSLGHLTCKKCTAEKLTNL